MQPESIGARLDDLQLAVNLFLDIHGERSAQAFIDIARGGQPDELTRRRILSSPLARVLTITPENELAFDHVNSYLISGFRIRDDFCFYLPRFVGPVLPPPHAKPPRPF